jgi:hypothetical protein
MSNYPTSLDSNSNLPTAFVPTNSFTATIANSIDSAIIALETKLGTGAVTPTTVGQVLTVTGTGATGFSAVPTTPTATSSVAGTIQLAGDLGGTPAAPAVASIKGVAVANAPVANQALVATSATSSSWQTLTNPVQRIVTGTFASAYAIPVNTCDTLRLVLTGNATLTVTGTPVDGQLLELHLIQDAVGSRTVTFSNTYFKFSTSLPVPTLSTAVNATDVLGFKYSASAGLWRYYGAILGF